ncbi:MAG: nuclear transport factor 2 family protein [Phycisphaeraceae bacterium]|nr:nuclear transport factor 2 family protein [Phycisphaeraceae bacterium]
MTQLESPSVLQLWLFEDPITPIVTMILLAVLLVWRARRRRRLADARWALVPVAIIVALMTSSTLVTTERERVMARALELVDLSAGNDAGRLAPFLHPDAMLGVRPNQPQLDRDEILERYERGVARHPIAAQDARVRGAQIHPDGSGQVRIDVGTRLQQPFGGQQYFRTTWLLTFEKDEQGRWLIRAMTWERIHNLVEPSLDLIRF